MERLTNKNKTLLYSEENQINLAREKNGIDAKTIYYGKPIESLAEFEDFMEANKFESIEELQNALNGKFENIFDEKHKIWIKVVEDKTYVEKRNRILEERWEKLKEFVYQYTSLAKECQSNSQASRMVQANKIYAKMQELEKED